MSKRLKKLGHQKIKADITLDILTEVIDIKELLQEILNKLRGVENDE